MSFKKGDKVVQIVQKPIEGIVEGFAVDQETGETQVRISYPDEDGSTHTRHFKPDELKSFE